MRSTQALTINLPPQLAEMVETKVRSGEYASESDVIVESLQTLLKRDAAIDMWIADEVLPTVQALDVGSGQTVSLDETKKRLHAHIDRLISRG